MITKEDLEKNYEKLTTSELIDIIDRKFLYTELAVVVAVSELAKRNVTEEEIAKHKEKITKGYIREIELNYIDDLTSFEKALFFIFCMPIFTFAFKNNYARDGHILKLKQANHFSLMGFISYIAALIINTVFNLSGIAFPVFLAILFFITLHYDQTIRRKKRLEIFTPEPLDKDDDEI
jgi:ABC-type xylose transport system permease subunit